MWEQQGKVLWRAAREARADRRRSEAERWPEFTALQKRSAIPTAEQTQTKLLRRSDWLQKRGNQISESSQEYRMNCKMRVSLLLLLLPL